MTRFQNILFGLAASAAFFAAPASSQTGVGDVVYVPTPQIVVDEMLRMAKVNANDYLIDLGSGDGRFVISAAKQGARAFGVDLDTYLLREARKNAQAAGVGERATFIEQNLFETDLSKATVVSTYLLPEMNLKLRPKILALKPGTRVVAHDYHMGSWYPDDQRDIIVPEKKVGTPGVSYVYLWLVPAKVAGKWQMQLPVSGKEQTAELTIEQAFQGVEGTVRWGSETAVVRGRLDGEEIVFTTPVGRGSPGGQRHEFKGRVSGDTMSGTVRIGEGATQRQGNWTAKLTARAEMKKASDDVAER